MSLPCDLGLVLAPLHGPEQLGAQVVLTASQTEVLKPNLRAYQVGDLGLVFDLPTIIIVKNLIPSTEGESHLSFALASFLVTILVTVLLSLPVSEKIIACFLP